MQKYAAKLNIAKWKLNKQNYLEIRVNGTCMEPFLYNNQKIIIKKTNQNIDIGDMVLTNTDGTLTIHRIVYKKNNSILTKGDNLMHFDGNKNIENIIGILCTDNGYEKKYKKFLAKISYMEGHLNTKYKLKKRKYILRLIKLTRVLRKACLKNIKQL